MPQNTPTVEGQASNARNDDDRKPKPLAFTIVESTEQTARRERTETEADKHDAKDLDAQIRAANAAEKQIRLGWASITLSFIGTLLIVWTLFLTRQANAIVRDTKKPRVLITLDNFKPDADRSFNVCVTNIGDSGCAILNTAYGWDEMVPGQSIASVKAVQSGKTVPVRNIEHVNGINGTNRYITVRINLDGPFLETSEKTIIKRFNVFADLMYPIGVHYTDA